MGSSKQYKNIVCPEIQGKKIQTANKRLLFIYLFILWRVIGNNNNLAYLIKGRN